MGRFRARSSRVDVRPHESGRDLHSDATTKGDETNDGKDFERKTARRRERDGCWLVRSVKLNASTTSSSSSSRSVALRDLVGLRYLGKRAVVVREDGSFVKMAWCFREERNERNARRGGV